MRIEGARGIWGNRTTGWGINIQLGGSIQRVGDQYRPWGINQKNWEINYTRSSAWRCQSPTLWHWLLPQGSLMSSLNVICNTEWLDAEPWRWGPYVHRKHVAHRLEHSSDYCMNATLGSVTRHSPLRTEPKCLGHTSHRRWIWALKKIQNSKKKKA